MSRYWEGRIMLIVYRGGGVFFKRWEGILVNVDDGEGNEGLGI